MEVDVEFEEWLHDPRTQAAKARFEAEARSSFEKLMKACELSQDPVVKSRYELHYNAMRMLAGLTGKVEYSFLDSVKRGIIAKPPQGDGNVGTG